MSGETTECIIAAIENNPADLIRALGGVPQVEFFDTPVPHYVSGLPHPSLNLAVGAPFAPGSTGAGIDEVVGHARARGAPMTWWIGPNRPSALHAEMEARGIKRISQMPGMARTLDDLGADVTTPPGLTVNPVRNTRDLQRFVEVISAGFELPGFVSGFLGQMTAEFGLADDSPYQSYVGVLDGEAVGASAMMLGSGAAGLYNIATVPGARGKGIGAAMTLAPLFEARKRGINLAVLHSSAMGQRVYERLGFQTYCTMDAYAWLEDQRD
jgi:ribosomal protein S18 acetylase RimI-like enzyme